MGMGNSMGPITSYSLEMASRSGGTMQPSTGGSTRRTLVGHGVVFPPRDDDAGPVRIESDPALGGDVDTVLEVTDFHQFHELEQSTIIRSGRNFFGEVFDQNPTHTIPFQVPDILPEPARLEVRLMGRPSGQPVPTRWSSVTALGRFCLQ